MLNIQAHTLILEWVVRVLSKWTIMECGISIFIDSLEVIDNQ